MSSSEEESEVIVFQPKTKKELIEALDEYDTFPERYGKISTWDTSLITDMSGLFKNKKDFNHNIEEWDVSNVTNMNEMFYKAK